MKVDNQLPPRFIKLTAPNGEPIYCNAVYFVAFFKDTTSRIAYGYTTIYTVESDTAILVREEPYEIRLLIEACYG